MMCRGQWRVGSVIQGLSGVTEEDYLVTAGFPNRCELMVWRWCIAKGLEISALLEVSKLGLFWWAVSSEALFAGFGWSELHNKGCSSFTPCKIRPGTSLVLSHEWCFQLPFSYLLLLLPLFLDKRDIWVLCCEPVLVHCPGWVYGLMRCMCLFSTCWSHAVLSP